MRSLTVRKSCWNILMPNIRWPNKAFKMKFPKTTLCNSNMISNFFWSSCLLVWVQMSREIGTIKNPLFWRVFLKAQDHPEHVWHFHHTLCHWSTHLLMNNHLALVAQHSNLDPTCAALIPHSFILNCSCQLPTIPFLQAGLSQNPSRKNNSLTAVSSALALLLKRS